MVLISLIFSVGAFAEGNQCLPLFNSTEKNYTFENGHNTGLRNIMLNIQKSEHEIQEFVDGLTPKAQSQFVRDRSQEFRNPEKLKNILEVAHKYQKILNHLVEHADHMMMTPRIQMIPAERRAEFIQKYKDSYVLYRDTFDRVVIELESFQTQDPSQWNNSMLKSIFMELHTQMGAAHNKF